MRFGVAFGGCAMIFQSGKAPKIRVFDERKTRLQCLLDAIMSLTFFDAVAIAIATCSYRDDNMMLSSCVHVVINLTTRCQIEVPSLGVDELQRKCFCKRKNRTLFFEFRVSKVLSSEVEMHIKRNPLAPKEQADFHIKTLSISLSVLL